MPRRLYWCSDSAFRGCLMRSIFRRLGHTVEIPGAPPNPDTGMLPRRGSTYPLQEATRLLAILGAEELVEIDRAEMCHSGSGAPGEIDFAARLSGSGRVLVAEVKTRLIPMEVYRGGARWRQLLSLMLRYHLDEPKGAHQAWRRLVGLGVVKPPDCKKGPRRGDYDNPASIAELIREAAGYVVARGVDKRLVIPAAVLLCSINSLVEEAESYVKRTARYLSSHGIGDGSYAVLIAGPDRFSEPAGYWLDCRGPACSMISDKWPLEVNHLEAYQGCPAYLPCKDCRYRGICGAYCRKYLIRSRPRRRA